jgi:hypothetical protein
MSKRSKRLAKLCAIPAPKDYSWDDLVALLCSVGFEERCNGGSHFTFTHTSSGFVLMVSRTHPSGILKSYQIKAAKDALRQIGALTEDENGSA